MTVFSPDTKIFTSHYRLVLTPTFIPPFGLEANFISPFGLSIPGAAAEENLGFIVPVGNFHFFTEKVKFVLPFSLEANFHITVWSGVRISYYRSAWGWISYYRPEFFGVR
jgi:hypothetical protein